jgi:uncharacterized protein YqhQ
MKPSNIGGQAVLEGIMMKHQAQYAVAVRTPQEEIKVIVDTYPGIAASYKWTKLPFIRGMFQFVDSMVLGMKTLTQSADVWAEEEETEKSEEKRAQENGLCYGITIAASLVISIALFMVLPYFLSRIVSGYTSSKALLVIVEGVIRMGVFLSYLFLVSRMKDIKRTFMYHGAEHKCINCIEHGKCLTVENVRASSKEHKRCGTSFLFFVMIVSMCVCFFITAKTMWMRLLLRILLLPLIAGISYEIIRVAGRSEHWFLNLLSKPGLWVQHITTKEPDDAMIEVAIAAVEAVFDWKGYLDENNATSVS